MTMTAMKTMTTTDDDGTSKIESGAIYPEGWKKKTEVRNYLLLCPCRGAELSCGRGQYARSFPCPLSLGRSFLGALDPESVILEGNGLSAGQVMGRLQIANARCAKRQLNHKTAQGVLDPSNILCLRSKLMQKTRWVIYTPRSQRPRRISSIFCRGYSNM